MSVFTPGHFTDLTGEAEAESGWQTPDEREEPRRDVRERKVQRERDRRYQHVDCGALISICSVSAPCQRVFQNILWARQEPFKI